MNDADGLSSIDAFNADVDPDRERDQTPSSPRRTGAIINSNAPAQLARGGT